MAEIKRIIPLPKETEDSIFLFGARQTGKTTALLQRYPNAIYFDLLESEVRRRFSQNPETLRRLLEDKPEGTLVIIDEIQNIPELLNEIQWLIVRKHITFILSGSSARKLRRNGTNMLGGRAIPYNMYPFVSHEIENFDLDRALVNGMLPRHYLSSNPWPLMQAYVNIYLKEEIQAEALVRNLNSFTKFLEVAAICDGEIINYTNIAQDCGVSSVTVKEYFQILSDTLIGFMVPAFSNTKDRKLVKASRFYYFDLGICNCLLNKKELTKGTPEYGHAFEHFVIQEIRAYLGYNSLADTYPLTYWRTSTGVEVDVVLGDAKVAIEIKSCDEIQTRHLKGLRSFGNDYPDARLIIVSQDIFNINHNGIEAIYIKDFLRMLWKGEIV
ncbi:MAG: AAA family ATPase [Bacteroidales bacterium]|nr:AAA family ATPase [Bacteroidales bacterium]